MGPLFLLFLLLAASPLLAEHVPTPAETARGFWFTASSDRHQQPLPLSGTLAVDLPLDEQRSLYIGIVPLRPLSGARVRVQVSGSVAGRVAVTREARRRPVEYRLWLRFASTAEAGTFTGTLTVNVQGAAGSVPLALTVWPVRLPETQPFDVRGYGDLLGSHEMARRSPLRV